MAPSSLLAKMFISPNRSPAPQTQPTQASDSQTSDIETVAMTSPVLLVRQMSISASCSSPGPCPTSFTSHPASESHTSDTDSVHMMSPVSPCRQMSIDYPDFDVPPSPPVPGKGGKLGQVRPVSSQSLSFPSFIPPSLHVHFTPYQYPTPYAFQCLESRMPGTSAKLL